MSSLKTITTELFNISEKSDQDIVRLCVEGHADAWDEFYKRFIPLMLNSIKSTLFGYGEFGSKFARDEGSLWDIFEIIYDRFRTKSLLKECRNPNGIRAWLATLAANQTKDRMKSLFTDNELPNRHAENSLSSLDQPIFDGSSLTLSDTDLTDADYEETLRDLLTEDTENAQSPEAVLAQISFAVLLHLSKLYHSKDATDRRKYWIARINYIFFYPLSDDEVDDIVEYADMTKMALLAKIDSAMKELDCSNEEKEAALGRAEILRHKLLRSQAKLNHFNNDPTPEGLIIRSDLEKTIASMSKRRADLLRTGLKAPRPSARQLIDILSLPQNLEKQVSKILSRLQQELLSVLNDQLKSSS